MKIRTICALTALLMLAALFTGCGGDKNTPNQTASPEINEPEQTVDNAELLPGEWSIVHDMYYTELLDMDEENRDYPYVCDVSTMDLLFLRLNEDGTYTLSRDREKYESDFAEGFYDGLEKIIKERIEILGIDYDLTVEDVMASSGTTIEDATFRMESVFYTLLTNFEKEGYWKAEDGKLYISNEDGEFDEQDYLIYHLIEHEGGLDELELIDMFSSTAPVSVLTRSPQAVNADE